ncbi:hypothetical protein ABID52_000428 [Fictibacillus halophilus]|uniref:DUF3139 domain-containing protein n=1 Tax=Fictibacillus halophilus TaxID=1610490 RepID=A0ABV2LH09_9BACL|nr:hypothetical protein [Fictibacillus halophilus]
MNPKELIEIITVGGALVTIVILSSFLKGKYRKISLSFAIILWLVFSVFFVVRPIWIDAQITKKVELLKPYLEKQYPNERWTITTVPHRKEGFKHLNPYVISVVFENEPAVTYYFWVKNKNNISQKGLSTSKNKHYLKHGDVKSTAE